MDTEKYTIQDVCNNLNLSKSHVQRLIREGQLKPSNPGKKPVNFSPGEVERLRQGILAKRLASLKKIAEACEEVGLYDEDFGDYERR